MKVALHDADKTSFPNLALMKLSSYHKARGDEVVWYDALWSHEYDKVYSSKVFTFTPTERLYGNVFYGGTGTSGRDLPDVVSLSNPPDYSLYGCDSSYGFLTRGCPNKCPWCIVPRKEGDIRPESDIEDFLRHDSAILMDNNVLAHPHGVQQIEKIAKMGIKIDFNQGLDARLIDDPMARLLAKVKWLAPIRLACDTAGQMKAIQKAVTHLRWHNATPRNYFVYVLVRTDISDAIERVRFLKGIGLDPFAQPYIDFDGKVKPTREQKQFARWVNHKAIFKSVTWEQYR
jgi:hypothetical protein